MSASDHYHIRYVRLGFARTLAVMHRFMVWSAPVRGVLQRLESLKMAWKGAWETQVRYQRVTQVYFFR